MLSVIVPKKEFIEKFEKFEKEWCNGFNFNGHEENITAYKESRRHTKEQQLRADFISLKNSLLQE